MPEIVKASVLPGRCLLVLALFTGSAPRLALAQPPPASVVGGDDLASGFDTIDLANPGFTRWERVVRGFRREHNFAATSGYTRGSWNVHSMGTVKDRTVADDGAWARAEYTYHLQIYEGFGYFLGSSMGATYTRTGSSEPVKPPTSFIYPGLVAGFVYNFSPAVRGLLSGGVNLERYDGLVESDGVDQDVEISMTMESYEVAAAMDIFVSLPLAIRAGYHDRYQKYRKPRSPEGKPVNASLERYDRWIGAGLVYHLM
ncbi:MAG: hypothetical protein RIQ81_850 [Pseudomonadota bacterium]|jgi:hypothetical protein